MTTGDIKNNLRKFISELKDVKYTNINMLDLEQFIVGLPAPYLPILHYVFAEYSYELTTYFMTKGYDFYGKNDSRFLDTIYKLLIQEFQLKPMLTKSQFFAVGFAEIKVIFVTKIVLLCKEKNNFILGKLGNKKRFKPKVSALEKAFEKSSQDYEGPVKSLDDNNVIQSLQENNSICTEAPKPHPDLALTPIKSKVDCKDIVEPHEGVVSSHFDSENSRFMFMEKPTGILPHVKITKHVMADKPECGIFNLPQVVSIEDDNSTQYQSLPALLPMEMQDKEQNCAKCIENSAVIQQLTCRLDEVEKSLSKSINVNNELCARVIVMDTQLKLLQSHVKYILEDVQELDKGQMTETIKMNDEKEKKSLEYSPIKYTDDEELIKGFKPIHVCDIAKLDTRNKENIYTDFSRIKRNANFPLQEVSQNVVLDLTADQNINFENNSTSETVRNVKKRLKETEKLLRKKI